MDSYAGDRGSRRPEVSLPPTASHAAGPAYEIGVGGGGRTIRGARARIGLLRGHGAGGLPGPGSFQIALGAREGSYRVETIGVAASVRDVNRCTVVVSDSPRRRSVGHASCSPLAISRRGSGELRSVTPATTRACPVGGPGDARRLGEPAFPLHASDTGVTSRRGRQAPSPQSESEGFASPRSQSATGSCPLQMRG